ncbi:MAG: DUF167 domain-containing protein [Kofleriaceae bacterium]|nr:DUF167 domain-containing protein [Kofleriaceae bacterium]
MPRASRARVGPIHDGRLKVFVTAPAVEGAANAAVIEAVAKAFAIKPHAIRIKTGLASRRKTLMLDDVTAADVAARLASFS